MYQLTTRCFVPWKFFPDEKKNDLITFDVKYDRTNLNVDDIISVNVKFKYNGKMPTNMVIIDLGIPAGFEVQPDAFEKMVAKRHIEKYQLTGRQIILYFGEIKPSQEFLFTYNLRAKYPVKVSVPVSKVYEYYTPHNCTTSKPFTITVAEKN